MDIEKVNSMDFGEFVDVFGNVIERCPLIAAAVWSQRPFSGLEDLEKHFFAFIDALPPSAVGLRGKRNRRGVPGPHRPKVSGGPPSRVRSGNVLNAGEEPAPYHRISGPRGKSNRLTFLPERAGWDQTAAQSKRAQISNSPRGEAARQKSAGIPLEQERDGAEILGQREKGRRLWVGRGGEGGWGQAQPSDSE
uniref:2-oxo-4-hydroxy-4-carboxy-5-ureidoimidazoline decarboxylase n=1 Tax=Sus scrofa TaxID=9823 RepID=A0A8D0U5X6_PIG